MKKNTPAKKKQQQEGGASAPPSSRLRAAKIMAAMHAVEGAKIQMLSGDGIENVQRLSSGSLGLDFAISGSEKMGFGFPRGRVVEIYGHESSGKTTLALGTVARAQAAGLVGAFVDAEHAADLKYFQGCGVDVPNLLFTQPDSGEAALSVVEQLVIQGVDVIVVDSVAALVPQAEIDGEMGASHVALQARLMSQALRKLTGPLAVSGSLLIFINQIREKVGVMFGNPNTTSGGRALKFYASVRLSTSRAGSIKRNEQEVGVLTRIKVEKNKVGPPLRQVEVPIIWGRGVDSLAELVELGFVQGVLERTGSWYSYKGERLGNGAEATRAALQANPALVAEIRERVMDKVIHGMAPVKPKEVD